MRPFTRTVPELERLSRMYNSDIEAARACEIAPHVLIAAWRQAKIETPNQRKKRRQREAKAGQTAMEDYGSRGSRGSRLMPHVDTTPREY